MTEIVGRYGATTVAHVDGDTYEITCTRCGENVRYRFAAFTDVEAMRHERWCAAHKGG